MLLPKSSNVTLRNKAQDLAAEEESSMEQLLRSTVTGKLHGLLSSNCKFIGPSLTHKYANSVRENACPSCKLMGIFLGVKRRGSCYEDTFKHSYRLLLCVLSSIIDMTIFSFM